MYTTPTYEFIRVMFSMLITWGIVILSKALGFNPAELWEYGLIFLVVWFAIHGITYVLHKWLN